MKKTLLATSLIACLSIMSVNVYAANENTVSIGYAQNNISAAGNSLNKDLKGFNFKYRYEINNALGLIGSFTHTHQGYNLSDGYGDVGSGDFDYYSFTAGPSYRFNEYVSAYGLIGAARGKVSLSVFDESVSESKTAMAYGVGVQFNPLPNIAIDASYEHTKLSDIKVGTWMLGVGYRF